MRTLICLVLLASPAFGQCYRRSYSYYPAASYASTYTYPYTDNRLQVSYYVNFPPPATTGATAYAYRPDQFQFLDATLAFNSAARLAGDQQAIAKQGFSELTQATVSILGAQAQVAEAQAQAAALAELAKIARETKPGQAATISRSASGQLTVQRTVTGPGADRGQRIQAAFNEACVTCHSPGGEYPKLDLRDLASLEEKWEPIIMQRILSDDPAKLMPPPRTGKTLPAAVVVDLIKASTLLRGAESAPQEVPGKPPGKIEPLKE